MWPWSKAQSEKAADRYAWVPPFDIRKLQAMVCPKCANCWRPNMERRLGFDTIIGPIGHPIRSYTGPEHLRLCCARCGYTEYMLCADAPARTVVAVT